MSDNIARLYEEDFVRWTEQNLPLDWRNLAEEIDDLGRSIRHELRSRISTIVEHLLKPEHSPASRPRHGWMDTIDRERSDIDRLLQKMPV